MTFNNLKLTITLLLISCLLFASISAVAANTVGVNTFSDMNSEIQAGNDVILTDNIYGLDNITGGILIDHNVTVDGAGYTIDAQKESRIFKVVDNSVLTLKNITLKNGYYYGYGGAIFADNATLKLTDVIFTDNTALIGGGLCCNNTNTDYLKNVIFVNNSAYVGAAVSILSHDVFDTKEIKFISNHAYCAVNVFSKGDVLIYLNSTLKYENVSKYYITNYNKNNAKNHEYDNIFSNYIVTAIDVDDLLNSLKSIPVSEFNYTEKDFKEVLNGLAFGKTYYVNNYEQLKYNIDRLHYLFNNIANSEYSYLLDNDIIKSKFVTAKIVLLPGDYKATSELIIGTTNYNMDITIIGNNQAIDCSKLNSNSLFKIIEGNLFLSNLTISNANNHINKKLHYLVTNENNAGLIINNCNFTNNTINTVVSCSYNWHLGEFTLTTNNETALINVNDLYIGSNVNFNNNDVNYIIKSESLLINGLNVNFINNIYEYSLINTEVTFINGIDINFTNNKPRYYISVTYNLLGKSLKLYKKFEYENIINGKYVYIISNNFNFNNNEANSCINAKYYAMISGNDMNFINNTGTVFVYEEGTNNNDFFKQFLDKDYNRIWLHKDLSYCRSILNEIYYKSYNLTNPTNSFNILGNVKFINNHGINGGVLYSKGGTIKIKNATFIGNSANYGGAICFAANKKYIIESDLIANNLIFINNTAKYGGAICIGDILNSYLVPDYHIYGGHHIGIASNNLTFNNNSATYGGAIYLDYCYKSNIISNKLIFENNTSQSLGSALYLEKNSVLNITGNYRFYNNTEYLKNTDISDLKSMPYHYCIDKNAILYLNDRLISSTQFMIMSNNIMDYKSNNLNLQSQIIPDEYIRNKNTLIPVNENLSNYVVSKVLKEYGINSVGELNETELILFYEKCTNEVNSLFESSNYKSYTISQDLYFADGTKKTRTTHYENIYSYDELKKFAKNINELKYDILILNLYGNEYLFNENFKLNFDIDEDTINDQTIFINGNGVTFKAKNHDPNDDYRALYVSNNFQHVYVNNITFINFNEPISNHGFLYLSNCTFYKNKIDYMVYQDYAGAIRNYGFLKCVNCSFIENSAKYGGAIYNEPGTYCAVINCTFKDNWAYDEDSYWDIYNYESNYDVNCTVNGTICTIHTDKGTPSFVKWIVVGVAAVVITVATALTAGAAGAALGGAIGAYVAGIGGSALTAVIGGVAAGAVAGALIGAAIGFVVGSLESVIISGLYRESIDQIWLDYAINGAITGAMTGFISGAIAGGVAAYKQFNFVLHYLNEELAINYGADLNHFNLNPLPVEDVPEFVVQFFFE